MQLMRPIRLANAADAAPGPAYAVYAAADEHSLCGSWRTQPMRHLTNAADAAYAAADERS